MVELDTFGGSIEKKDLVQAPDEVIEGSQGRGDRIRFIVTLLDEPRCAWEKKTNQGCGVFPLATTDLDLFEP